MRNISAFFRTSLIVALIFVGCNRSENRDPRVDTLQARLDSIIQYQQKQATLAKDVDTAPSEKEKGTSTTISDGVRQVAQRTSVETQPATTEITHSKQDEEVSEWKKFRDDEEKYTGTKLKWRIEIVQINTFHP